MTENNNESRRESLALLPHERKERLKIILSKVKLLAETNNEQIIKTFETCMEETDEIDADTPLEDKIQNQDIIVLDSEAMNMSSKILQAYKTCVTTIVSTYDANDFAERLVKYIQNESNNETETVDWSILETEVTKHFRAELHYSSFLGALDPLEKQQITKQRAPIVRQPKAVVKRPEKTVTVEKQGESIEFTVKIYKLISRQFKNNRQPIDYFKFVLDPTDFGKTVENILQIAFLVRDQYVEIKDLNGILVMEPVKNKKAEGSTAKRPSIQNIFYLNMEQWKTLKDIYRLEKPMIDFCS